MAVCSLLTLLVSLLLQTGMIQVAAAATTGSPDASVTVNFNNVLSTTAKDSFAIDESGYPGGGPVLGNDAREQQQLKNLGVGMVRIGLKYATPGNPNSPIQCDGSGCDIAVSGDQYVQAILAMGADPIVIVPFNDTADDASLVKHYNVDLKYGIKRWIVGNETAGGSAAYNPAFDAAYTAMKAIDPTILIGGPANPFFMCCNTAPAPAGDFIPHFLTAEGSKVDFIDYHAYGEGTKTKTPSDSALLAQAASYQTDLSNLRSLLQSTVPNRTIGIEVGEFGLDTDGIDPRFNTQLSALWYAMAIGNMLKNGAYAMPYATKTGPGPNMLGLLDGNDQPMPAYHAYGMFTGEGLFNGFGSQVVSASASTADLVPFASNNGQNIVIVNQNPTATHTVGFSLAGTNATAADVWIKDTTQPPNAAPRKAGTIQIFGNAFNYILPPYSIATFVLNATSSSGGGGGSQPPANHCVSSMPSVLGSATMTATLPQAGTYRVWSRMRTPDTTNTSYYIQIDGCSNQVSTAGQPGQWTWVDYYGGQASSTLDLNLATGTHTVAMLGTQPGVALDRVILTSDLTCVPTGTGDNCGGTSTVPPPQPQPSVTVTATTVTATSVNLSWTNPSVSFNHYVVGRDSGITLGSTTQNVYIDTSPTPGQHKYTVYGADAANNLTALGSVTVTVPTPQTPPPPSPTSVVTASSVSAQRVVLTWTMPSSGSFPQYRVNRDTTVIGTTASLTFTDSAPIPGNHTYVIYGLDANGTASPLGSVVVAVPSASPSPSPSPSPSGGVSASVVSSNQVKVSWGSATGSVNHYRVQKDAAGITVGTTTGTSLIDSNVTSGSHQYSVYSVDSGGRETLLGKATVTVPTGPTSGGGGPQSTPPVTATVSQGKVTLNWTKPSSFTANHYRIQRDSSGTTVGTTTQTTFTDSTVPSGSHFYIVFAINQNGYTEVNLGRVDVVVP